MASKPVPPIEIEDASQLSILAYQVQTNRVVDLERFLERLNSEHARRIAKVIAAEQTKGTKMNTVGDDTLRLAQYYLRWAEDTANSARTTSKRAAESSRKDRD